MLDLSIVIVNYRSWAKIESCLQSLVQQTDLAQEIIVVDNYSNDGILEKFIEKFPFITWIKNNKNDGFAAACNIGARKASTKWLLFLNPDTNLPKDCLPTLIPFCDLHSEYHLISIKQLDEKGNNTHPYGIFPNALNSLGLIRSLNRLFLFPDQTKRAISKNSVSYPQWISGSFVLIRAKHFNLLNGWDEKFWIYFEDVDLSKRAFEKGLKRVLLNDWQCIHSHGVSSRQNKTIKILTKSEVVKSNHKYIDKHFVGNTRIIAHIWLRLHKSLELILMGIIDPSKKKIFKTLMPFWYQLFSKQVKP